MSNLANPVCASGTMQSPIDLKSGAFSTVQAPTFKYATAAAGALTNWGYGPSMTLNSTNGKDSSSNPSFTANGTSYYLLGFVRLSISSNSH